IPTIPMSTGADHSPVSEGRLELPTWARCPGVTVDGAEGVTDPVGWIRGRRATDHVVAVVSSRVWVVRFMVSRTPTLATGEREAQEERRRRFTTRSPAALECREA